MRVKPVFVPKHHITSVRGHRERNNDSEAYKRGLISFCAVKILVATWYPYCLLVSIDRVQMFVAFGITVDFVFGGDDLILQSFLEKWVVCTHDFPVNASRPQWKNSRKNLGLQFDVTNLFTKGYILVGIIQTPGWLLLWLTQSLAWSVHTC